MLFQLSKILVVILTLIVSTSQIHATSPNYFQTSGSRIIDAQGQEVHFNGINWFGFETSNFAPHGLWQRSMDDMLDQVKEKGYNLLRIPFCNEMLNPDVMARGIDFYKNPDLQGLTPIEILDTLISKARERDMKVFLDRHRPTSSGQSELWYTSTLSEERWINDWQMLAQRYLGDDTVIGADLHNEPHGTASWGTGNLATDWRLAAERAGNAILRVNPHWLIIVEGVEGNVKGDSTTYWWGGNLSGVKNYPVRLSIPNHVVYSPHDYGPGVFWQKWFSDPTFPNNLDSIWNKYWSYIQKENLAPVLIGEFGGFNATLTTTEGIWQNKLIDYIAENNIYWTYWCLNPNSGDTGGLLKDDWVSWDDTKQEMLERAMK